MLLDMMTKSRPFVSHRMYTLFVVRCYLASQRSSIWILGFANLNRIL